MNDFGNTAKGLAKNPLGILALFIVLVYSISAALVFSKTTLTPHERMPIICFLIAFPVLVLAVFIYLVVKHHEKLFAPSDFRSDEAYMQTLRGVGLLTAANVASGNPDVAPISSEDINNIVTGTYSLYSKTRKKYELLWVDDYPRNNDFLREAFEPLGFTFTEARSTREALEAMRRKKFAAIISDMGRLEGEREGLVLLEDIRNRGDEIPFFIYASHPQMRYREEALKMGAQGCSAIPTEIYQMVTAALLQKDN